MKHILLTIAIAITTAANAQDWKEFHILPSGDTVRPGMKVTISEKGAMRYISPSMYDVRQSPYKLERIERNKRFMITEMPGKTYTISRLTRMRGSGKYIAVAVLLIGDRSMSYVDNTEFNIFIDNAVANNEVVIIK